MNIPIADHAGREEMIDKLAYCGVLDEIADAAATGQLDRRNITDDAEQILIAIGVIESTGRAA